MGHDHPISSPCDHNGSGELKTMDPGPVAQWLDRPLPEQ